jgi:hypothetical protein
MCPRRRVTEKSQLFHTNHRSGRDRESKPGPPAWQAAALTAQPSTTTYSSLFSALLSLMTASFPLLPATRKRRRNVAHFFCGTNLLRRQRLGSGGRRHSGGWRGAEAEQISSREQQRVKSIHPKCGHLAKASSRYKISSQCQECSLLLIAPQLSIDPSTCRWTINGHFQLAGPEISAQP